MMNEEQIECLRKIVKNYAPLEIKYLEKQKKIAKIEILKYKLSFNKFKEFNIRLSKKLIIEFDSQIKELNEILLELEKEKVEFNGFKAKRIINIFLKYKDQEFNRLVKILKKLEDNEIKKLNIVKREVNLIRSDCLNKEFSILDSMYRKIDSRMER